MAKKRTLPPEILPDPTEVLAPGALPDDGFVRGSSKDEVKATGSQGMKLWVYSPAKVLLLTEPTRGLAEVARLRGMANRKVEQVEVILHAPTRRLFIYPPDPDEEVDDAFEVAYRNQGTNAEINIRTLLQPRGLEVTRGWREQYDVKLEEHSECGPALVFQLTTNPVRERVGGGRKSVTEAEESAPAPTKAKAKRVAGAKASATEPEVKAAATEKAKSKSTRQKQGEGTAPASEQADTPD